jgi:hypothetical protein
MNEKINDILGLSEPWCLDSVLKRSQKGLDILLHNYNYDGNCWEELQHCLEKINDYRRKIDNYLIEYNKPEIIVDLNLILNTYNGLRKTKNDNGLIFFNGSCDEFEIYFLGEREYRIIVDNFPFPRRFYDTSIPWRNLEEFENDLKRMKLKIPSKLNN